MAKSKISSKDFLDLLDEQNDQPAPAAGSFGKTPPPLSSAMSGSNIPQLKQEPVKSGVRTGNKLATNQEQTGNKVGSELATNWQHIKNEAKAESLTFIKTGNKVGSELATLSATKWQQTENKPATNLPFSALVGLQRNIMVFLYDACKTARSRATAALTLEHIGTCLKTSAGSAKTSIQRLEEKGCITRVEFKNGRGGWSKYELPEVLFREMLQLETENKLATNREQTGNKLGSELATEPATSLSSSSSLIDSTQNLKTTTSEPELLETGPAHLSPDWVDLDFSPLSEIGFTKSHLIQIIRQGVLSRAEVQDSVHFFAFDLKQNGKGRELKGPPLNFFMGILRKGLPYAPPENYESPEAEARRKYLDGKRRLETRRLAEEQELQALAFTEWRRGLTQSQTIAMVPDPVKDIPRAREAAIRNHFDEQVWPDIEAERFGITETERDQIRSAISKSLSGESE